MRAPGIVMATILLLTTMGASGVLAQSDSEVAVVDNAYQPASVEVTAGDTVRWTQTGSNPHTVTADDGSFDSHPNCPPACMGEGDTFERTFDTAGEFGYYCKIHGGPGGQGMSGVVLVQAAQEAPGEDAPEEEPPAQEENDDGEADSEEGLESVTSEDDGDAEGGAATTTEADEETSAGELPRTGPSSQLSLIALLGAGLLGVGASAVVSSRRRRFDGS